MELSNTGNQKINKVAVEDASDEGGTCPPKPVMPNKEEDNTEDIEVDVDDDLTNGIFTQRDPKRQPNGSLSDDTESILSECSGLYPMLYFISAK